MKECCDITSSKRIYASDYQSDGIPFFRGKEIVEKFKGVSEISTKLYISVDKYGQIKSRFGVPKHGDILLTSVGTLGIPYLVNEGKKFYFKDGNLTWFRDFRDLDSSYLYYWLVSPAGKAQLQKATIGTSQSAYTIDRLKELDITLPPLIIQGEIASILSAYDDLIENNRRRIQLLEESARLLYREWFVRFRFPGHEHVKIIDGVPEGWEKKQLGDLLTLQRGFDLPVKNRKEGPYPIYASTGINGFHNVAKVAGPGVITGRSGSLGTVMYVSGSFWPLNTALWVKEFKQVSPLFAFHLLSGMKLEQYNGGAAVPTLNRNDVHRVETLCPAKYVVRLFDGYISSLYLQIETLERSIKFLAQGRDFLLPRLMNGEIKV
jgi:type I restriction enzyme S subunit